MTKLQGLRLIYHFIRGAIDPKNLKHSIRAGNVLNESGAFDVVVEHLHRQPGGTEFLTHPPLRFRRPLESFQRYPEGSLGREYCAHMHRLGLDPEALPVVAIKDQASYVENIIREVHDVWHVITEFDASFEGEIGLQAFKMRQMNWPFAMLATAAVCLITLFKTPERIPLLAEQMARGFRLAEQYHPLILVDWNQHWHKPLAQVREELRHEAFRLPPLRRSETVSAGFFEPASERA